ncbi:ski-like protein isoform X1 [Pantherophis guttatus]|uniref:Ski-like protein isoform X1 n=2 Tax=Pantherophis guttatus TaxID=94885 RepID=A0ABM3YSR1_PANGU|nr:ski-like protein isoform X1 [Pantherophis guttatus]
MCAMEAPQKKIILGHPSKGTVAQEDGSPPSKKVMTEIHVKDKIHTMVNKLPVIKKEHLDECEENPIDDREEDAKPNIAAATEPLNLNPGLKHTLAQFHLSSQSSLGGPAAFSARHSQENMSSVFVPLPSPQILPGPLLVPSDSSTELTQTLLEGESISCFKVGGEKRLCLPQVLNSVLRDYSLQQINTVCDELYIYCSRCSSDQLHILKVLGILPFNAPSCGLITLTDAQRLCNALLRPRTFPQNGSLLHAKSSLAQLKETGSAFEVEHECLGKCQGLFAPQFYLQPDSPCIQCSECYGMFSPQTFVMHSHRSPDKRTCHWGFESAKWHCYLHINQKYLGTSEERNVKQLLEQMKEKFSTKTQKIPQSKADSHYNVEFQQWYPVIKQETDSTDQPHSFIHPSYFFYMCDKVVAPNVSLSTSMPQCKETTKTVEKISEVYKSFPGQSLKQQNGSKRKKSIFYQDIALEGQEKGDLKPRSGICASIVDHPIPIKPANRRKTEQVSSRETTEDEMEISSDAQSSSQALSNGTGSDDDKGKMMEEVMKTYIKQQERLHTILQKKQHLQMEVEMLSSSKAMKELTEEQQNLQKELESLQTEHAQRMQEFYVEQRDLEKKLEQVIKQKCTCDSSLEKDKEAEYAAQLAELRQRLDHAEADRQELQDELRQEREARQKLEKMIKELKLQIQKSSKNGKGK